MGNMFEQPGGWAILLIGSLLMIGWVTWHLVTTRRAVTGDQSDLVAFARRDSSIGALGRVVYFLVAAVLGLLFVDVAWQVVAAGLLTAVALWGLERCWPQPAGTVRTALVRRRRWSEVVTRTGVWLTVLAVVLLIWSVGWAVVRHVSGGAVLAVGGLLVTAVVVGLGMAGMLRRHSLAGLDEADDARLRRAAADRMLRVVGVSAAFMAASFFGQVRSAAAAADRAAGVADGGWPIQVPSLAALLLILALISIGRVRMPGPRRGRRQRNRTSMNARR